MLLPELSSRKRLTTTAIAEYIRAVHLAETGHPCSVEDVERTLDWTRNHRYREEVVEYCRHRARIVNSDKTYWVWVGLWRTDGDLESASVNYHGEHRPS